MLIMKNDSDFTITIPCWNNTDVVGPGLMAICETFHHVAEIILVDNHSPYPDTSEFIHGLGRNYPSVQVVRPNRAATISECLNFGFREAETEYYIAMDDDVMIREVDPIRLKFLLGIHPEIGILSPMYSQDSDVWKEGYDLTCNSLEPGILYEPKMGINGAFMTMRCCDLGRIALHSDYGVPFAEPGVYGYHDVIISENVRKTLEMRIVYDNLQCIYHRSATIEDGEILAWKSYCQEGHTRLSFRDWRRLYVQMGGDWLQSPILKVKEVLGTRVFRDEWARIRGMLQGDVRFT